MTLSSFMRGIGGVAALFLVACSNPPARPSQNQGQNPGDPAAAASPRPPSVAPAPVNPQGEAPRPVPPGDPSRGTATAPAPAMPRVIPAQPGPEAPARPRPCIDIRPVLMRCKPGERLTHEGCPKPAYMQHCAPDGS